MRVPGVRAKPLDYMNGARARTDYSPGWKHGPPGRRCKGVEVVRIRRGVIVNGIVFALLAALVHAVSAQARRAEARVASEGGDWPTYNRDLAGTRYSPLTQIDTKNVATLAQAWSYRLRPQPGTAVPAIDKPASSFEIFQQVTPIVVNGVM